jgi:hypothetical protein
MTPAESLDKVTNSSQNVEGVKRTKKRVSKRISTAGSKEVDNSELEYWKNKALELEGKQNQVVYENISPNDMIEVISACGDKLNLNTKQHNLGNRYTFDYFGETKNIMFSELSQIKENQRNFARKGYFIVNNVSAVRMLGLEEDYKRILDVNKIKELLSNSPNAESLFKSANEGQQGIIINMLINKMVAGENVDMNLVHKVSELSGVDINQRVSFQKESIERNKLTE